MSRLEVGVDLIKRENLVKPGVSFCCQIHAATPAPVLFSWRASLCFVIRLQLSSLFCPLPSSLPTPSPASPSSRVSFCCLQPKNLHRLIVCPCSAWDLANSSSSEFTRNSVARAVRSCAQRTRAGVVRTAAGWESGDLGLVSALPVN